MRCEPSVLARKIVGTFVEDAPEPVEPTFRWLQQECRTGVFREIVEGFCQQQDEDVQPRLVTVESFSAEGIVCVVPGRQRDHESSRPYPVEVQFLIEPSARTARRL